VDASGLRVPIRSRLDDLLVPRGTYGTSVYFAFCGDESQITRLAFTHVGREPSRVGSQQIPSHKTLVIGSGLLGGASALRTLQRLFGSVPPENLEVSERKRIILFSQFYNWTPVAQILRKNTK
jgi:hypothetical protein